MAPDTAARQHVETYHGVCDCQAELRLEAEKITRAPAVVVEVRCPNCMQPVTLNLCPDEDQPSASDTP